MSALPDPAPPTSPSRPRLRHRRNPNQAQRARGEPMLWLCGGGLLLAAAMIVGLLLLVFGQGIGTFWPDPVVQFRLHDGSAVLGEVTRRESYRPEPADRAGLVDGMAHRQLLRTGNFELTGEHYRWVPDHLVAATSQPAWALVIERVEWGRFYGMPTAFLADGAVLAQGPADAWHHFELHHADTRTAFHQRERLRLHEIGRLSNREEDARLAARAEALRHGEDSPAHRAALRQAELVQADCAERRQELDAELARLDAQLQRHALQVQTADGRVQILPLATIVRAYPANQLGGFQRLGVYLDRWREFLVEDPRGSNTEGGVYPAIFGTVLMTLLMSIAVVPFGVLAALYMREYARGGALISAVRIAVNNLAGVPSIVFGAFGFGFFCYIVGGSIDSAFYPERLPSPTFGKGALVWASLTLALLTLPVVIVATEEALAAVPGSMREGSYACGASKWQTIRRIVLPRAMPGIMTGAILAMARGAGEVAPLMLVGAAKLAPELPLDGEPPFLHPSRSFMHLGFHIYDLGFQSQNSEAAKPMVYTTTLLLIATIALLNLLAIWLRSRLRRHFVGAQF